MVYLRGDNQKTLFCLSYILGSEVEVNVFGIQSKDSPRGLKVFIIILNFDGLFDFYNIVIKEYCVFCDSRSISPLPTQIDSYFVDAYPGSKLDPFPRNVPRSVPSSKIQTGKRVFFADFINIGYYRERVLPPPGVQIVSMYIDTYACSKVQLYLNFPVVLREKHEAWPQVFFH